MSKANVEVSKVKKTILFSVCILLLYSLKPDVSYAQTKDELLKGYATTEDIVLQIMKPEIEHIFLEKYGENFIDWHYNNREIIDLKLIQDLSTPKWFEVTVFVVYDLTNAGDNKASITLKIIPPVFSTDHEMTDIVIKLIDITLFERVS